MPLPAETELGPFAILSPLGAGGMGEGYRASGLPLGREAPPKTLPAEVANDPVRRQRFELEARDVAALDHPNIVAVYDFGEGYIVSELHRASRSQTGQHPAEPRRPRAPEGFTKIDDATFDNGKIAVTDHSGQTLVLTASQGI